MTNRLARRLACLSTVVLLSGGGAVSAAVHPVPHPGSPVAEARRAWMARDANPNHAWLYVNGEDTNIVYIHDLDKLGFPEIGRITDGVSKPFGMTVDRQGTLYLVNQHGVGSAPGNVTIYPAGATSPNLTLSDGLVNPQGVAVDASGNVYVTNRGPSPGIAVYAPGQTALSQYIIDPLISRPIQDTFDSSGNLYFSDPDTGVSEIPIGSQQPVSLGLQGLTQATGITIDPTDGNLFVDNFLGHGGLYTLLAYASGAQTPMRSLQRNIAGYYLAMGSIRHEQVLFVPAFFSNAVFIFKHNARKPVTTLTEASQAGSVAYKAAGVP
jgi:DNA-binding beta-propeller fold protein YncE